MLPVELTECMACGRTIRYSEANENMVCPYCAMAGYTTSCHFCGRALRTPECKDHGDRNSQQTYIKGMKDDRELGTLLLSPLRKANVRGETPVLSMSDDV